jgi:agmatine/peptidylarginine deiminase
MKFSLLAAAAFAFSIENVLPNWLDDAETVDSGFTAQDHRAELLNITAPSGFRVPAEYEPVSAVIIGYKGFTAMLQKIAIATVNYGAAEVWAVSGPRTISGVSMSKYKPISASLNSVWYNIHLSRMRDYGPVGVSGSNKLTYMDNIYRHYQYRTLDDQAPIAVANYAGIDVFSTSLILDGGNYMVDSFGNLFMTKVTYSWNSDKSTSEVDRILKESFNAKEVYTFEYAGYPGSPADGTGHIDMFVKLLSDDVVMISVADVEPYKSAGNKAVQFFTGRLAPTGNIYKVITVGGWVQNRAWYTYTNSLIVNNAVIIPSYSGRESEELLAIEAYKQGMPNITVVPVNSDQSIVSGGSIHCVTQTVPLA